MGKPTGFMEITRQTSLELPPEERIRNFNEFHVPLHTDEQQAQGARCMDCGVPFCQSGVQLLIQRRFLVGIQFYHDSPPYWPHKKFKN